MKYKKVRSLKQLEAHPLVESIDAEYNWDYNKPDYWVYLIDGYHNSEAGTHCFHDHRAGVISDFNNYVERCDSASARCDCKRVQSIAPPSAPSSFYPTLDDGTEMTVEEKKELEEALMMVTIEMLRELKHGEERNLTDSFVLYHYSEEDMYVINMSKRTRGDDVIFIWDELYAVLWDDDGISFEEL